jgi:serine O-acetyltransferase
VKWVSIDIGRMYKIARITRKYRLNWIARVFDKCNNLIHNSFLSSETNIGKGTIFAYGGIGLVIHKDAVIGKNCMIGQGITIGGIGGSDRKKLPIIEDNVYIGAGARILGNIRIGHDSIIAPNSVVLKSIESYTVVGGIPAKVISRIDKKGYEEKYKYYYGISNYINEIKDISDDLKED